LTETQKIIILKWINRYKRAQIAHSHTAIDYGRFHFFLGITLIVLTTASCVLIFATDQRIPQWLSPSVSIAAALFAYLQTFLQLSEQADTHRKVARRYGAMKKNLEYLLEFSNTSACLSEEINTVRIKADEIASESPHASSRRWKTAKAETS